MVVTKAYLVKKLMQGTRGLSRTQAIQFVESFFDQISKSLFSGEEVKISGFGNFKILDKKARPGRNPKTGESVLIKARRVVTFQPSVILKRKVSES